MKVVAFFHLKEVRWSLHDSTLARWRERFPQLEVVSVEDGSTVAGRRWPDAEIFVGWRLPPEHFGAAPPVALDPFGVGRYRRLSLPGAGGERRDR